jgi:hypothetical protein
VDFATVDEAIRWIEMTKGELIIKDSEVRLDYSHQEGEEWTCILVNRGFFFDRKFCSYPNYAMKVHIFMSFLLFSAE